MPKLSLCSAFLLLAACGDVTPAALELEADAADVGVTRVTVDAGAGVGEVSAPVEAPAPPSCPPPAAACDACTQAGPTGPGYPSADVCRSVVACVLSGAQTGYPLQSCHNLAGGSADWGGLSCVKALLELHCPTAPL
jgi:hypothetical protein